MSYSDYKYTNVDALYAIITLKDLQDFYKLSLQTSVYERLADILLYIISDFDFKNNGEFKSTLEPLYYCCRHTIAERNTYTGHRRLMLESDIMNTAQKLSKTRLSNGLYFLTTGDFYGTMCRTKKLDDRYYHDFKNITGTYL